MQRLITQKDSRPCLICSQKGTRHAVEVLPDGGILFMVAHDDGRICKWAEYSNNFGPKPEKKKGVDPTYIICPECHKRGRLNWKYDLQAPKVERPFSFKYLVVHEKIGGTWGKVKTNKRRRCQSFTREQRISILKQIGRYISDPPTAAQTKKTHKSTKLGVKNKVKKTIQQDLKPVGAASKEKIKLDRIIES